MAQFFFICAKLAEFGFEGIVNIIILFFSFDSEREEEVIMEIKKPRELFNYIFVNIFRFRYQVWIFSFIKNKVDTKFLTLDGG